MSGKKIRILLADDHAVLRSALGVLLGKSKDLELAGEVDDGISAIAAHTKLRPDVTLLDLNMPRMGGLGALAGILEKDPTAKILILTNYDFEEEIFRALELGACGYLSKTVGHRELFEAIRAAHCGEKWIPPEIAARLKSREPEDALSDREMEALHLLGRGFTNKDMGLAMGISERGAKFHVEKILAKLHAADRTEAVGEAYRRGLLKVQS